MSSVPFSGHFTASLASLNNRHRLRQIRRFIGSNQLGNILDVGAENYIGLNLPATDWTAGDLNRTMRTRLDTYDTVTCFEIINHVFNAGTLMDNIRLKLKDGGKLYLSTPRLGWFAYAHGKANFMELKPWVLRQLLEYKGFKIKREKVFRSYPFRFVFYGFLQPLRYFHPFEGDTIKHPGAPKAKWYTFGLRPPIKFLLHRYTLIEATKI